jgi:hypothetical protein
MNRPGCCRAGRASQLTEGRRLSLIERGRTMFGSQLFVS